MHRKPRKFAVRPGERINECRPSRNVRIAGDAQSVGRHVLVYNDSAAGPEAADRSEEASHALVAPQFKRAALPQ
jgi:hypothetical protein